MKNLKKVLTLCSLALVFTVVMANIAAAQATGGSVMETALAKSLELFKNIKVLIFVVGAFGLIGIAFQAIFGKVKWTWFAGLAVGLAILAAAGAIVNYATGGNIQSKNMGDSFSQSAAGI